jgi:hypothetical protein
MSDESADVAEGAERAELRALLRSAVRGLGASEQDLIQLQLRQELDVAEIAAMLGVSRNHAHALLSRARAQLEVCMGALLVARSGRGDCEALGALLEDWDGQLNVLMRKRINRHIERCPACTERKRRELAPALLLGLAPLPLAVMPPGLRTQVLRLVSSDAPGAVAHRASVAKRADMSGPGGFPKPLDPPKSAWWQARSVQGAAAAAVVVAAAVLVILAVTGAFGTHPGQLSALSHGTSSAGVRPAVPAALAAPVARAAREAREARRTPPRAARPGCRPLRLRVARPRRAAAPRHRRSRPATARRLATARHPAAPRRRRRAVRLPRPRPRRPGRSGWHPGRSWSARYPASA